MSVTVDPHGQAWRDRDPDDADNKVIVDRTANNQLAAPEHTDDLADDIDHIGADDTDDDPELSAAVETAVWDSPLRAPLQRFADRPLPTLTSTIAATRWWGWYLGLGLLNLLAHFPQLAAAQIPHMLRGIAKGGGTYSRWRAKSEWLESAKHAEGNQRALRVENVERAKRGATRSTLLIVVALFAAALYCMITGLVWPLLAAVVVGLLVADLIGRRDAPATGGPEILPRSPFREGAPSRMVVADVRAVLEKIGHPPETLSVVEPRVQRHGLSMTVHSDAVLDEIAVSAIERGLQTYRGAVSTIGDPNNAALTELRIMWEDPLSASCAPLRLVPGSISIADPAVLGYGIGGVPLELNLMRVNLGIVGGPGSGKSSSMWALIAHLVACRDVVLHGIDLSGGPMLNAWGDAIQGDVAFDRDAAVALLERRIASAIRRTRTLAGRSRPTLDGPAPGSENWEPSDGMFHVVLIDELPLLAKDPVLCGLLAEHQRIGRKAGETSVWASQDMNRETIGATSLRKYPSTIILHSCSRDDVTTALGGGKVAEGWAPHRLAPAEGDDANDAGKCFIRSGRHTRPVPWRMARLDNLADIWERALEAVAAGRPTDDADTAGKAAGGDGGEDVADATIVPEPVARLLRVFAAEGNPEFLPSERICAVLNEGIDDPDQMMTGRRIADSLRPYDVTSRRPRVGGSSTRGYALADLRKVER